MFRANYSHALPVAAGFVVLGSSLYPPLAYAQTSAAVFEEAVYTGAAADASAQPLKVIPVSQEVPADPVPEKHAREEPVLEEVIVTAQKREQKLQDVPIAITVVSGKQLQQQNIGNVQDLTRTAPSVEVFGQPGNPDTRTSIRGISTNSFSVTAEQAVSFVADGVVLGKTPAVSLFDVAQIEVLRGPQGTLFGKNSSAGVISITTNKPDPTAFEVIGHADLSNSYDYRLVQSTVNVPLGDHAAVRLSGGQTYQKGFITNVVRDEPSVADIKGGRMRFMWEPSDELTFNVIADYEKVLTTEQLYLQYALYDDPNTEGPDPIPGCKGTFASPDNRRSCAADPTTYDNESWGFSGQVDWLFGDHTVTSISSFRRYLQQGELDVDGMPGNYYNNGNVFDNRVFTQEVRIASPGGEDLEYVAGVFYSTSDVHNFLTQIIGADALASVATSGNLGLSLCTNLGLCLNDLVSLNNPNQYDASLKSSAVFGQVTYRLFDSLRVIGGLRYTHDDISMTSVSLIGVGLSLMPTPPALIPMNDPLSGTDKVDNLSWRAGLQYDVTPVSMAYLTVSHGYKGPQVVFNPPGILPTLNLTQGEAALPAPASISIVKPEYPMDYELGFKTLLWGGFFANLNLFHTSIKDFQSSTFNAQGTSTPNNIPRIVTQGVEIDLFGKPIPGLTLTGAALYNPVEYPRYYVQCSTTVPGPQCGDNPETEPEEDDQENVKGTQLTGAPRWKFTLSGEYEHALPYLKWNGFVSSDVVYRSNIRFVASRNPEAESGAHAIVGARIGVRSPQNAWSVALFARNLFDERYSQFTYAPYLLSALSSPGIETSGHALSTESFRFVGLTLDARF